MERVKALQLAHSWLGLSKQQIQEQLELLPILDQTQLYATYKNIDLVTRLNAQPDPIEDDEALDIIMLHKTTGHHGITNPIIIKGIGSFLNSPQRLVEATLAEAHHDAILKLWDIVGNDREEIMKILVQKGLMKKLESH